MNANGPEYPTKLTIGSADDPSNDYTITAHYNPKDIDLTHQANWADEGSLNGMTASVRDWFNDIQYTGAASRTMALELFLDDCEAPYEAPRQTIGTVIQILHALASPRDEHSTNSQLRRPHICLVAWGQKRGPAFRCVIESIAVKYTMFSREGVPLRAICNLKLKEARMRKELPGVIGYLIGA